MFKRGSKWYVYITFPDGKRFRKSVGTKKQAEQVLHSMQSKLVQGKWGLLQHGDILFSELVDEYLEYAAVTNAKNTVRSDKSRIQNHLLPFFGDMVLREITVQAVDRYKAKRVREDGSVKTINNELLNLSAILKQGVRWQYLDRNVVSDVEKMRVPKNPPRFLSQDEIKRLVTAAEGSHIYPLIVTALHTGMRKSELLNLEWSDVDFGQGAITVQSKEGWHTKNYRSRIFQLTPMLDRVLRDCPRYPNHSYVFTYKGKPIKCCIKRSFGSAVRRAGLGPVKRREDRVTLHTLRHTFASQLVTAGVPLRDVQELMGHRSYDTTLRYAHLAPDHVKKQVLNLPFANG